MRRVPRLEGEQELGALRYVIFRQSPNRVWNRMGLEMKAFRPTSILQLTLIGFAVVAGAFILALLSALIRVDELAKLSQRTAFNATLALHSGRTLVEELTKMERHVRQYQVLEDPAFWTLYLNGHETFARAAEELGKLDIIRSDQKLLNELSTSEQRLHRIFHEDSSSEQEIAQAIDEFSVLSELARSLVAEITERIVEEAESAREYAAATRRVLVFQAAGLMSIAVALGGLFTYLITRPLRQIDLSIRRLGAGDFSAAIVVSGPNDLEELGKRLEWLRQRLMELETQKIGVLRHISHELKTPLTAIRESAELLCEGIVGPLTTEQAEITEILRDNSKKLQERIEDLLRFSVARTPRRPSDAKPVNLAALVDQICFNQKLAIKAKQLHVQTRLEPISVLGDEEQLRIILDNLLSNAVKFSPVEGTITIDSGMSGDKALVDVRDRGPGIALGDRSRIFEPFYQGAGLGTGHVKGTGLGLAIAKELAEIHGGEIAVIDCERGVRMRLTLPSYRQ